MPKGLSVNIGDLIALGGALTYSLYVFRIGAFTKLGLDGSQLQAWKSFFLAFMYSAWGFTDFCVTQNRDDDDNTVCRLERPDNLVVDCILGDRWGVLGRCRSGERARIGFGAGDASDFIGEPLFASALGAVFLGEVLGPLGYLGGGMLLSGGLMCSLAEGSGTEEINTTKED